MAAILPALFALFPALFALLLLAAAPAGLGEPATARYAPAQLRVAQDLLERARAAAALGEVGRAGKLAWQARIVFAFVSACAQPPTFSSDDSVVPGSIGVTVRQQRTAVIVTGV